MSEGSGAAAITGAIAASAGPALCAYVTAGFPSREAFPDVLRSVAAAADLVEVGLPFTDPMADGLTIQASNRAALSAGVTLEWIFDLLEAEHRVLEAPHLLMGYYNPFLSHGLERLASSLARSGTSGLIVPDLPLEESGPIGEALSPGSRALVQMVAPTTPLRRLERLTAASAGFVYAVTTTGVTGQVDLDPADLDHLARVKHAATLPVLAGFGIRSRRQVAAVARFVDGVVVGSALIEVIESGEDPGEFLRGLRISEVPA
jgi:tryptophan synthase alpha chain